MVSIRALTPNYLRKDVKMTRKELQKWLDQFPPDAEICHRVHSKGDTDYVKVESQYIELLYSQSGDDWKKLVDPEEIYLLACDRNRIDFSKVKRIIF
jgi:hypothetical protein